MKKMAREVTGSLNARTMPTDWGGVAEWYDELVGESGSEFHREVVLPGVMRMLPLGAGEKFLDVACGQGVLCRLMAAKGVDCVGVDSALDLVRMARERAKQVGGIVGEGKVGRQSYEVMDARELMSLPGEGFDGAACVLAIQNIHPIGAVFAGVKRCLKVGGRFVVVMMHPAFRGPRETSWGWDEKLGVQYRRVDKYLKPRKHPIVMHPGKKGGEYTWTFHRPMEEYVKGMVKAGLLVDGMEEWASHRVSTSGPRARAENVAREEVPMFWALRGVRGEGMKAKEEG